MDGKNIQNFDTLEFRSQQTREWLASIDEILTSREEGRPERDNLTSILISPGLNAGRRSKYDKRLMEFERQSEAKARADVLRDVAADLRLLRTDVRSRANRAFAFIIVFAILSSAVILVAIGLAVTGIVYGAILSTLGGLLSSGAATIFWRLYLIETRRADDLMHDLQLAESIRIRYLLSVNTPEPSDGHMLLTPVERPNCSDAP